MARVAKLQDQSQAEGARYVYIQHATVTSRRGHTVHCQEITDYRIAPSTSGSNEQILDLSGRLLLKGRYVDYHSLAPDKGHPEDNDSVSIELGDDDTDRDMVENMRKNLLGANAKDGINANLFLLTTKEQAAEEFVYVRRERLNGRDVDHVSFRPKTNPTSAGRATPGLIPSPASPSSSAPPSPAVFPPRFGFSSAPTSPAWDLPSSMPPARRRLVSRFLFH